MAEENTPNVIWQVDSTQPEVASRLREALKEVVDPEIGLNIIELGLVRDVVIEKDKANVNMILTTPFCPYGPALLDIARQKQKKRLVSLQPSNWVWKCGIFR